jgi:hypothetical protein
MPFLQIQTVIHITICFVSTRPYFQKNLQDFKKIERVQTCLNAFAPPQYFGLKIPYFLK